LQELESWHSYSVVQKLWKKFEAFGLGVSGDSNTEINVVIVNDLKHKRLAQKEAPHGITPN
jgi:hypothetical protein